MKITITVDTDQPGDVAVDIAGAPIVPRFPTHDEFEDAARYRYIRKGEYTLDQERHWNPGAVSHGMAIRIGDDLDERVDAARFGEIPS